MSSVQSPRKPDKRLVMYRFSKFRSYSVGSGVGRGRRKADFNDSDVVTVNTNAKTDVIATRTAGDTAAVNDRPEERSKEEDMASTKGFARLDVSTLQTIGWSPKLPEDANKIDKQIKSVDDYYKLTKVEFRRLQEQVRDVSMNLKNKFRTSAYQVPPCDQPGCKVE